ncbi:MAG: DUF3568 family protein [Planctomycetota bacterium]
MQIRWNKWLLLTLLLAVGVSNAGCIAVLAGGAAAGAAGYAYAKGSEERSYPQPVSEVASAVEASLVEMELSPVLHEKDKAGSITKTRTSTGKDIRVETQPVGQGSEVKIRVGTFGDREIESLFFQHLDAQLSRQQRLTVPPVPVSDSPTVENS